MVLLIVTWRRGSRILVAEDAPRRSAARRADPQPGEEAAAHRARHRGVPHQRSGLRAGLADAQSQAQQGAARAQHHPHHRDRRHAARQRRTSASQITPISERFTRVDAALRLHGDAERAEGARDRAQAGAGSSTSCRRRSSCRAARSSRRRKSGMPALAGPAVHRARASAPTTRPTSSRSRPAAWWRSERRWRCERSARDVAALRSPFRL